MAGSLFPKAPASKASGAGWKARSLGPAPRHQQAQFFGRAISRIGRADFSAADYKQTRRHREQLVEIARDEQDRAAIGSEVEQDTMHVGGRREVKSARDVMGDNYPRILGQRASHFEALTIPPRERRRARLGTSRTDAKAG